MKEFNAWLNGVPPIMRDIYRASFGLSGLRPVEVNGQIGFPPQSLDEARALCPSRSTPAQWFDILNHAAGRGATCLFELWALAGFYHDGIRAYCPTHDEFIALARVEVRVPWSSYRQAFPVMTLVIPPAAFPAPVSADIGIPVAAIVRHDAERRLFSMAIPGTAQGGLASLSSQHCWREGATQTIEDHIGEMPEGENIDASESAAVAVICRAAINANLLLTHYGARRLGAANPDHERRLLLSLEKKNLPEAARKANAVALHAIPVLYGFDQHVRVYECEGHPGATDHNGHPVKPHWRRGHWANIACGVGRTDRRLHFRPAVLVNAHRFGGKSSDTRVTLTTAKAG